MSDRRALMSAVSGGSLETIKRSTYTFNGTDGGSTSVPINEDSSKILFCHFYDTESEYTTANTTYEGFHVGPAAAHYPDIGISAQWAFWRTNAAGSTTGYNNYGQSNPFATDGYVRVSSNPYLKSTITYVLEVYYLD